MPTQYNTCQNPLVVDLIAGQLMTTSDAIAGGSPQILDLQNDTIIPASELPVPPSCNIGACNDSDCPNGRELGYLSIINEIELNIGSASNVEVTLVAATFTDNENPVPQTANYEIEFREGVTGFISINVGDTLSYSVAALPNGQYRGRIRETNSGAYSMFWYAVTGGNVVAVLERRETNISLDLSCDLYPNYTMSVSDIGEIAAQLSSYKFTSSEVKIFGNIVNTESYGGGGVLTYNETGDASGDMTDASDQIVVSHIYTNSLTEFQNTAILRTQCIEL